MSCPRVADRLAGLITNELRHNMTSYIDLIIDIDIVFGLEC